MRLGVVFRRVVMKHHVGLKIVEGWQRRHATVLGVDNNPELGALVRVVASGSRLPNAYRGYCC